MRQAHYSQSLFEQIAIKPTQGECTDSIESAAKALEKSNKTFVK